MGCALLARGELLGLGRASDVDDVDLAADEQDEGRKGTVTDVLLRVPGLREDGVLASVHDMRLRHREVVRAAEGCNRGALETC